MVNKMKIDYNNMVANGCFSFAMVFVSFVAGSDLYVRNKWLGALACVFISMIVFFYINSISYKLNLINLR